MAEKEFMIKLMALLDQQKTKAQLNKDIKQLQGTINKIKLIGTFSKGSTKSELNQIIKQMEGQLKQIKMQAKVDSRQINREINNALRNVSVRDIQLNVNHGRLTLQMRRALSEARAFAERNPIGVNIDLKKQTLNNKLTSFLGKNTKINESSYWLSEAERLRTVINSATNPSEIRNATEQWKVFTTGVHATGYATISTTDKIKGMLSSVVKIGNYFGIALIAVNKFRQSLGNMKEMDTILTEISKTTDLTAQKLEELGRRSYSIASKYGVLAKNFMTSMQEMSRAGFGEGKAEPLAELATLAQSAGALTSDLANDYLIASNAAYGYQGNIEKLNALLDSQNQVTNRNAVSMTELAEATKVAANQLSNAAISEQEMTALLGSGIATTKESGQVVGRAVKAIVMNLQQVKNTDEGLETTDEDLGKVEKRLRSLGIQMKETSDGVTRLRNPITLLKELSEVYNSLPKDSAERANIISDIGGKYRGNILSSILSNWSTYTKMLGDYQNAEGSALKEAEKSADSFAGRLNRLENTWNEFVESITSKNSIKGGITFLDNSIQQFQKLTDTIGAIPVLLTAVNASMASLNKNYGITQIMNGGKINIQGNFMGIDFTKLSHFKEASAAMNEWNTKLANNTANIDNFNRAVVKNNAQLKAYLQTTSVQAPASLSGYKSFLNAAGVSTDALRLKTVLLTTAMTFGISMAIQLAVSSIAKLIQAQEDACQAAQEAAKAYSETTSSINDYAKKYEELYTALLNARGNEEETYNVKKQLLDLQKDLNDEFGTEYEKLNLTTDAYKNKTDAIKAYNEEVSNKFLNETPDLDTAEEEMTKSREYTLGYVALETDAGKEIQSIVNEFSDSGLKIISTRIGNAITLEANVTDAEKTITDFMNRVREKEEGIGNTNVTEGLLETTREKLGKVNKVIENYGGQYSKKLNAEILTKDNLASKYEKATQAVHAYNEAILRAEDPFSDENVQIAYEDLQAIKGEIQNDDSWTKYKSAIDEVWESADTKVFDLNAAIKSNEDGIGQFLEKIKGANDLDLKSKIDGDGADIVYNSLIKYAKKYDMTVEELIDSLVNLKYIQGQITNDKTDDLVTPLTKSQVIEKINALSTGFESIDKIMSSIKEKDKTFDYALLDDKNFKENFEGLGDSYTDFIEKISDSPKDIKACQGAFDTLVTEWLTSKQVLSGLSEDTAELTTNMLENMGVTNASELVQNALAQSKAEAAWSSRDLTYATVDEINALAEEAGATEETKNAYKVYIAQKMLVNSLDPTGDITALKNIVESLGIASQAWQEYYQTRDRIAKIEANPNYHSLDEEGNVVTKEQELKYQNELLEKQEKERAKELQNLLEKGSYGGGTKANKSNGGGSKAAKENSDIDWIAQRNKILQNEKQKLESQLADTYTAYTGLSKAEIDRVNELMNVDTVPTEDAWNELVALASKADMSVTELTERIKDGTGLENKQSLLERLMLLDDKIIENAESSVEDYRNSYEALISLVPEYRDKIENGAKDIELFPSDLSKPITNAINAYSKLSDAEKAVEDAKKEKRDHKEEYLSTDLSSLDEENARLEKMNGLLEDQINYIKASGEVVGIDLYQQQLNNFERQVQNYARQVKFAKNKLATLDPDEDSEKYSKLMQEVDSYESSRLQALEAIAKKEFEIAKIPINNLEIIIGMYNNITSAIENWGAELEASGKKLDAGYYQSLISNGATIIDQYKEQADLIQDVMQEYDKGSDNWNELYGQLQSVNSEMSSMVQNLHKYNEELLNMPMDSIKQYSESLNKVLSGFNTQKSEYDTVISAVTGAIKDQLDVLEAENTLTNESYANRVKLLQDQLDLLEKTNTERNLQYSLEKAQYDLDRAQNQKVNAEIRNGEKVYVRDEDAVRDAQKAKQDALYDITKNNLQNQIDDLNKDLDGINEKYSTQTEELQKQSDKWSEIVGKIQQAQDELQANDILGTGWKDKVTSGNDTDIYDMFRNLYQSNADQILKYTEQIESTDNIYSLLEDYIASYKDGTISYEQAMNGINDLLSQMNQKMSATDNLQNIFDYLGTVGGMEANADAILSGLQSSLAQTADELLKSMEQYNKNSGMISEYTTSWQQLTNNVSDMKSLLEDVRDALDRAADRDDDDEGDHDYKYSESGGPRHNDDQDPFNGPGVFEKGIEQGLVGSKNTDEREATLKLLGIKHLSDDEIAAILHKGEAVYNPLQQSTILDNLNTAYNHVPNLNLPDLSQLNLNAPHSNTNHVEVKMGDISLPNVKNYEQFFKEFTEGFKIGINQYVNETFR